MASRSTLPSASCIRKSWLENGGRILEELAGAQVGAVGLLQARLDRIGQVGGQNLVVNARDGGRVADREDHLAALEEVARHPVGRAEIDFVVAAVGKVEDARVLEETADDGAHADALREPFDAGPQDARARE